MNRIKSALRIFVVLIMCAVFPIACFASCTKDDANKGTDNTQESPVEEIKPFEYSDNNTCIYMGKYPQTVDLSVSVDDVKTGSFNENTGWYLYNDVEYKIVKSSLYNPTQTVFSTGDNAENDKEYAFKVEPIKWKIIYSPSGMILVLSEKLLYPTCYKQIDENVVYFENSDYYNISGDLTIDDCIYVNNWEHSTIRSWINTSFYNVAFSDIEKNAMLTSTVDNTSTTYSNNAYAIAQKNTNDKLFVLSYLDVNRLNYGFLSDDNRKKVATDFAIACGAGVYSNNMGFWWTRSSSTKSNYVSSINQTGAISNTKSVTLTHYCVCPATWIVL